MPASLTAAPASLLTVPVLPPLLQEWGKLLVSPLVARMQVGCATLEDAAMQYALAGQPAASRKTMRLCISALKQYMQQQPAYDEDVNPLAVPEHAFDGQPAEELLGCVEARLPLYASFAKHPDRKSQQVGAGRAAGAAHAYGCCCRQLVPCCFPSATACLTCRAHHA